MLCVQTHGNHIFLNAYVLIVTRHQKIGLVCTKYIASHYSMYLILCVSYTDSVNYNYPLCSVLVTKVSLISYCMFMHKLMKLKSPKSSQILCANKPYFLMPGHNSTVKFAGLNTHSLNPIKFFTEIFSHCLGQQCLLFNHS